LSTAPLTWALLHRSYLAIKVIAMIGPFALMSTKRRRHGVGR
jgi:hypothetical protein